MKRDIPEFSLEEVDAPTDVPKVDEIMSVADTERGVILKSRDFVVTGQNLTYKQAWGDEITLSYDGLATPLALTPAESDYAHMRFDWPEAIAEVEDGTILEFKFKLHGSEGGMEQVVKTYAIFRTNA